MESKVDSATANSDVGEAITFGAMPQYPIDSVDNALRLISVFCSRGQIRVKDAADMLGVSTGTAHRLLAMLVYRGFASQDPKTKLYTHGPMLLTIGLRSVHRMDLRDHAKPHLKQLNEQLDETVYLATLEGANVLYLDGYESSKTLRVSSRTGVLDPAHCTSVGKALLAGLPRERLMLLYPDDELTQMTSRSIGSRSELLLELDSIRSRGYATDFGELEAGINSIAVAVQPGGGHAEAAIGVGAPAMRIDDLDIRRIAAAATEAATHLSADLDRT